MRLLLLSNSTNAGENYFQHALKPVADFLGTNSSEILFIPYAGIAISFDVYSDLVNEKFREIGCQISSVHKTDDPVKAVENAKAIVIGGGNTFHLLYLLQKNNLIYPIREKVLSGTPFIGWSAGSNIACPTIKTTNDMPVIQPLNFEALNFVPFQINPHYLDVNPAGHAGETREARISEFIEINPDIYVIGLREGTYLKMESNRLSYFGSKSARIFKKNMKPIELFQNDDFNFLLSL